jgi:CMP-N-acetylneuraminic acid synthetase
MRVLGIIPARGGSKGVPRKNIRLLCGKPLLAYTIESSLQAKRLARTILSTEDNEIAEVGRTHGADVQFLRPVELAQDNTPSFDVVLHTVNELESQGDVYDAVCLLQPTNPLRRSADIDICIGLLESSGSDSVISVLSVPDPYNPKWVYWRNAQGELSLSTGESSPVSRRQDLPAAFHRDGSIYVTRRNVLDDHRNLYGTKVHGYELNAENSVNIDTVEDWTSAEKILDMRGSITSAS